MREIDTQIVENRLCEMILKSEHNLTSSCKEALQKAYHNEDNEMSKFALEQILNNAFISASSPFPLCQDTGYACIMLDIGQDVVFKGKYIIQAVNDGVRRAYKEGYLRKSVCDPITRQNTADNTPAQIYTNYCKGDKVKITFLPKGFGSENMSKLYMLTPAQGVEGIIESIVKTVETAGSKPCPPVYVGVGIGGTFDSCAYLAKHALTREVGSHSDREDIRQIEIEALRRINELDIGCQGFGGKTSCIGVSCEWLPTHIAGLPVAVNIQCHCVRCEVSEI